MFKSLLLVSLFATSTALAQAVPEGSYSIDAAHSKVGFEIDHLVISTVEGKFTSFSGAINIDKTIGKSIADVSVDISSIDTSNKDRDDHLRSADFFDVAKFPKMTFKSKTVILKGKDLTLKGDLTIKGTTKSVIFKGKYLGAAKGLYGEERIAFKASTEINRQEYGLSWSKAVEAGPVVGDEVEIDLVIEAVKDAPKAAAK